MRVPPTAVSFLRPKEKSKVIEVVEGAGIDVSDWAASTKGNPETNPRYCYEWVFGDADSQILFCLWFNHMDEDDQGIFQSYTLWPAIKELETRGKGTAAKRARRLDEAFQRAFHSQTPVRVAIVDGRMRLDFDDEASKVEFRQLDSAPWMVTGYDWNDGRFVIRRLGRSKESEAASSTSEPSAPHPEEGLAKDLQELAERTLAPTTRSALINARLGQGRFRSQLMDAWDHACAATGCAVEALLRASHIKPWSKSSDEERLDPDNGLLLTANLDALFDRGLITFDDDGTLVAAAKLGTATATELQLPKRLRKPLSNRQRSYLADHRERTFLGRK